MAFIKSVTEERQQRGDPASRVLGILAKESLNQVFWPGGGGGCEDDDVQCCSQP